MFALEAAISLIKGPLVATRSLTNRAKEVRESDHQRSIEGRFRKQCHYVTPFIKQTRMHVDTGAWCLRLLCRRALMNADGDQCALNAMSRVTKPVCFCI